MTAVPRAPRAEGTVLLRIWVEPHDGRVRARMFPDPTGEGHPLIGVEQILEAVESAVRAYAVTGR